MADVLDKLAKEYKSKQGFLPEAGRQLGKFAQGILGGPDTNAFSTKFGPYVDPNKEPGFMENASKFPGKVLGAGKEMLMGPWRAMTGQPQPGGSIENAPRTIGDRMASTAAVALGGDPDAMMEKKYSGDRGGYYAAALTVPATMTAIGGLLGKMLGKGLPSEETQINKLTASTGAPGGKGAASIPAAYQQVRPRLLRALQPIIKGKDRVGPKDILAGVQGAMQDAETEFQSALTPHQNVKIAGHPISQAIMSEADKISPKTAEGRTMIQALKARALEFQNEWSLRDLDLERHRLFRMSKDPVAERQAMRTNADRMADVAAERAIRHAEYSALEGLTGKPGAFSALKKDQAALYDLRDQLETRTTQLDNQEALRRGTPFLQRENASLFANPETGKIGASVHRLQNIMGGPKSLDAAEKAATRAVVPRPRFRGPARAGAAALGGSVPRSRLLDDEDEDSQ